MAEKSITKKSSRDDFTSATKRILASRVAYRCSFPGCERITIGPGTKSTNTVITLGQAAHIFSAAPNGPRNNPSLTPEERRSVENGIWMCNHHGSLIDHDEINYAPDTLKTWKLEAENFVRERLQSLEKEVSPTPPTLIMLSMDLVLRCRWVAVEEETWLFRLQGFLIGSITELLNHIGRLSTLPQWQRYVAVESQGDGRMLETLSLKEETGDYVMRCVLRPKTPRTNPHELGGDLAMDDDGDLVLADGDIGMVHGIGTALQIIRSNLSSEFGWWGNPFIGSHFYAIYSNYRATGGVLNSLVKMELARLLTVSTPRGVFGTEVDEDAPELDFINRINWVRVGEHDPTKAYLPLQISLEWGNNENWTGEVKIPFSDAAVEN